MTTLCKKCGKSIEKHWSGRIRHDFMSRTPSEQRAYDEGLKFGIELGKKEGREELQKEFRALIDCQNTCNC